MPGDILSQIASYLPLPEVIQFLSLHPYLLSLTQSHLSPIPLSIKSTLSLPNYPKELSIITHLNHFLPPNSEDAKKIFIQILVRAKTKWILENFEFLRWNDSFWKNAFEKRFLPSWKRYKTDEDNWRAVYLRLLGRVEHRQSGCNHEEAWTRFVTLHRNGSASINRMYSRTFDPYEIYDELKNQNNFSAHPTTVRVILHLQDVRILAVGVLIDQPSLFVNPNAHLALHPPLLRHLSGPQDDGPVDQSRWFRSKHESHSKRSRTQSPAALANEAYFPLVQPLSNTSTHAQTQNQTNTEIIPSSIGPIPIPLTVESTASPPTSPPTGSFGRILGSYIPGRRRTSSNAASISSHQDNHQSQVQAPFGASAMSSSLGNLGGVLTAVRSRDSDDGKRRTWSFGRNRTGSSSNILSDNSNLHRTSSNIAGPSTAITMELPALTEVSSQDRQSEKTTPFVANTDPFDHLVQDRPYDILQYPQPALSHSRYPNFTPLPSSTEDSDIDNSKLTKDIRNQHPEIDDEYEGGLWAGDATWGDDGKRMAEWDESIGKRRRWVGPMLLIAQIHPSDRITPHPPGLNPALPLEGSNPNLGQNGMYASLGFEDVEALFPWIKLKGSGGNSGEAKRSGLGF
ncbi:uncharacterized protein L201_007802 [Kwoniella dendrophila CBS 6074]|uniref:F-box domain-containing protein n=1 Tax=Kwoniella dendrophila CBS 6074 TaxID=1295534 RepID=A0AAX4K5K1_9TREE